MLLFKTNTIHQELDHLEKEWTIEELFTCYEPLSSEPLAVRVGAMQQAVFMAEEYFSELSEAAQLRYHFWKQLRTSRIEERKYQYSVTSRSTCQWELTVNSQGLFYKDLNPMYGETAGRVHEQLFSDFWFYGPKMPMPNLDDRKWAVSQIRNAFLQIGPVSQKHFQLFEYPPLIATRQWEDGDHVAKDYLDMQPYGLEYTRWNWHDGPSYPGFISFERLLADPTGLEWAVTPAIRAEVFEHLKIKDEKSHRPQDPIDLIKARMKQMYMSNGGMHHYIFREHGDEYSATPAEEQLWKNQMLDEMAEQLKKIDHYSGFQFIATVMRYHGVSNIEQQFLEAAKLPNLKARQAIGQVLAEQRYDEAAAQVTLSLLEFEDESDYWRNYVFNYLGNMRENKAVQRFVIQCLKGDNEIYFKKAVEVLISWGMKGDKELNNRDLWLSLNWQDACAADPHFNHALEKAIKIIENN